MEAVEINLPCGISTGEQWHRSAWLHPITGHEQEFLLHEGNQLSAAARVTQLIVRCLLRLGPVAPVDADTVRKLTVGDREAVLLHLRRVTMGDRMSCVLVCPACGKKMDLDLQTNELLLPPYPNPGSEHETEISDGDNCFRVVFRLPNGEDQEAAAIKASDSVEAAAEFVLRRCVRRVTTSANVLVPELPAVLMRELPSRMAELDPQAEVLLDLTCPECSSSFVLPFDTADFVCREFALQGHDLYRGVHALSLHYHWSEEAILRLSRRKRNIYLELLAEELGSRRHA